MSEQDHPQTPEPDAPEPEYEPPRAEDIAGEDRAATASWIETGFDSRVTGRPERVTIGARRGRAGRCGTSRGACAGWLRGLPRRSPLDRPIGVKLELTHRCNLRCGFCFTDSPRRTLEGTPDISDETWMRVAEDAIAAGVIEAVVTGGEPLLRKDLALSVIETFAEAGVAVSLVTNGWFVDEAVADRIAAIGDVRVHVSVDGASPEVHDAVRGVPGSWRRAVRAIDLLVARDVPVQVNHTISSANAATLQSCLEHLWLLGPGTIGTATVVPIGAAARAREWRVDAAVMHREIRSVPAARLRRRRVLRHLLRRPFQGWTGGRRPRCWCDPTEPCSSTPCTRSASAASTTGSRRSGSGSTRSRPAVRSPSGGERCGAGAACRMRRSCPTGTSRWRSRARARRPSRAARGGAGR